MRAAIECAKKGVGHTFPNPAVGCVLVRDGQVIGRGFHPRAGFPHAEVFALLQAAGKVECGVAAAESVLKQDEHYDTIVDLALQYSAPGGPEHLFANCCVGSRDSGGGGDALPVTAYVTLEPCCHYGQTPPCAATLVAAKVARVVVGFRDPNPRVDGGGVKMLQEATTTTTTTGKIDVTMAHGALQRECATLVANFCKRIAPPPPRGDDTDLADNNGHESSSVVTGKIRRGLRALSARRQKEGILPEVSWGGEAIAAVDTAGKDMETAVGELEIAPEWMEHVDGILWQHELVLLRLGKAVQKRRGATLLGHIVADQLRAHVVQTKGHTVLLYRPGLPAVLDLNTLGDEPDAKVAAAQAAVKDDEF